MDAKAIGRGLSDTMQAWGVSLHVPVELIVRRLIFVVFFR